MTEELKNNKEIASATSVLIGSVFGYRLGVEMKSEAPVIPMLIGGYVGKLAIELLLK